MNDNSIQIVISALDKTKAAFESVGKQIDGLAKKGVELEGKIKTLQPAFKTMAVVGGAAFTGLTIELKRFVDTAGELEQQKVAFETMLGSAEEAEKMLKDLSDFATKTPFEIQGIRQSAKQLMAMGIEAENVIPTLKMLGDVSAGLSIDLDRVALNFGQVKAQGKLTGRELRDFAIMGVPLIDELSKSLGVTKEEISDMVSRGEIGFKEVEQAFKNMTSEGGKFGNLMDKQSKTFAGSVSNMKDEMTRLKESIGAAFLPALTSIVNKITPIIEKITEWASQNQELVKNIILVTGALAALVAGIGTAGLLINTLMTSVKAISVVLGITQVALLATVGKITLIIAAITALIVIILKFKDQIMVAILTFKNFMLTLEQGIYKLFGLKDAYAQTTQEIAANNLKIEEYQKKISDSKNKVDNLGKSQADLTKNLGLSTDAMEDFGTKTKMVMGLTEDQFKDVINTAKDLENKIKDINKEITDLEKKYQKELISDREDYEESVAEIVAKAEYERSRLKNEIWQKEQERADASEIEDLRRKLAEQESILLTYAQMNLGIENEIAEQKEYLRMNELQQLEFNYRKKALMREAEMLTEKLNKLQELVDTQNQLTAIIGIFGKEKEAFVKKEIEKTKTFKEQLDAQYDYLKNWKESVLEVYRNMAQQASQINIAPRISTPSVSAGFSQFPASFKSYQEGTSFVPQTGLYQLHRGESVIPAGKKEGIVVNINGGYYLSEDAAEDLGNKIIDKLKMQFSF